MNLYDFIPDFFFGGTKFECNLCGFRANKWLPRGHNYPIIRELKIIGAGKRYADCKKCGSSDRDRLIFEYFKELNNSISLQNKTLLHIAPEKQLSQIIEARFHLNVTRIDYRAKGYRFVYDKSVVHGDVQQLQYEDEQFDMVICNHVLEHVEDDNKAISEIRRVLKKGGFAILQVPISLEIENTIEANKDWTSKEKIKKLGQFDHLRLYGNNFKKILSKHGFEPLFWSFNNETSLNRLRLNHSEFVIIASKSNQ